MGIGNKILLIILGLLVIAGLSSVASYNNLVSLRQGTDAQWAQVQNVYQRRTDLVPNLVSTVSGAANFEKSTLLAVTEARASVGKVQLPAGAAPYRSRPARGIRAGAGPAGIRPLAAPRGLRAISRPQGDRQLPGPSVAARGGRKTGSRSSAAASMTPSRPMIPRS